MNCKYCGYTHAARQYPAYGKKCIKCKKLNHLAKVRQSANQGKTVHNYKTTDDIVSHADEVSQYQELPNDMCFDLQTKNNSKEWYFTATCSKTTLKLKVDAGATCNVMPNSVFLSLNMHGAANLQNYHDSHSFFGGHKLTVLGKASPMLAYKTNFSVYDFVVVEQDVSKLLGLPS